MTRMLFIRSVQVVVLAFQDDRKKDTSFQMGHKVERTKIMKRVVSVKGSQNAKDKFGNVGKCRYNNNYHINISARWTHVYMSATLRT